MERGLTQKQAAEALLVNPWTVLNWEKDRSPPRTIDLGRVIAFLGYNPLPVPTTVPEWLLHVRRKHGWSIREAARELGVDPSTWGNWERGELIFFKSHRTKVARLLGLDPNELTDEMRTRWNGKHRRWECRET